MCSLVVIDIVIVFVSFIISSKDSRKSKHKIMGKYWICVSVDFSLLYFMFQLQKVDVTSRAVMEIMAKTIEYLQPNPGEDASL